MNTAASAQGAPDAAEGENVTEETGGPAILVLEDGRVFHGRSFGATGETFGEAVFNTGMTGYQQTLTDPSHHRQIVVMTAPHIGNTGINDEDPGSGRVWAAGLVAREPSRVTSHWRSQRSLHEEMRSQGVVGIALTGTRALTRHLRDKGVMRAAVSTVETDPKALLARVLEQPTMAGADLSAEVSTQNPYEILPPEGGRPRCHVVAVDLGIRSMTPQRLSERGCRVTVLPADATAKDILALAPDGVLLSDGPGDPATADTPMAAVRGILDAGTPLFGIGFGNQLLGRALGLNTYKLHFGHRGLNQPVRDTRTGRVAITGQNHGFAVDAPLDGPFDTPYGRAEVSHVGLNDQVVEGLRLLDRPAFGVQFHPEAAAGPHDAAELFDEFVELMSAQPAPAAEQ